MTEFMEIMGRSVLFRGLPAEELVRLERISEVRRYGKSAILFREGEEGAGFYVVASGQVKVFKTSFDGREQILHILGPGAPLGEVPVFAGQTFPASAQALAESSLYFFHRSSLVRLYQDNPSLAMNMLAVLARRLREFTVLIENLSLKEIPQRLAAYLLYQHAQAPVSARVKLTVSKGVLANILGASQETLSRVLARLSQEGLIEVQGREIVILNRDKLKDLAGGEISL